MSDHLDKIVESLSSLTLLQAAELSKKLEGHWGVSAAAPVAAAGFPAAAAAAPAVEERTEFDVILTGFDEKSKINVIKEIRAITSLGLGEAKSFVESAPKAIKDGIAKAEADEIKKKLEAVGAKVDIK